MSQDPSVRRILPQDQPSHQQSSQMASFSYAPQQYPQREIQKNFVFVDEHNRHKRLKVMRACEGCRRRKIKCDAATTNTWPCSACIRLKLHCVRPNGFDGAESGFEPPPPHQTGQYHQLQMQQQQPLQDGSSQSGGVYSQDGFQDDYTSSYNVIPFDASQPSANLHYAALAPPSSVDGQSYNANVFPTPPSQQGQQHVEESSPEAYSPDSYQQQDLADLLGTLKMDSTGTAPYLRNKASFRREETPAVEDDDDYESALPAIPMTPGRGMKIRIPPLLMPDNETATHYFNLYFTHVHPYVPVLNRSMFYQQWNTNPQSISPLVLEAMFAIGGRLAEDAGEGQQWMALVSKHADYFMDVPRLSTLQALLMILKAREAAPKRGYYYRSWMTVVHCVQMAKDLGLDEHLEDHEAGRHCDFGPRECDLRTRIWKIVFVCETMVGTPQGRYDLTVDMDSVDFDPPQPNPAIEESEYQVSRKFTYFARNVRNIRKITAVYMRLRKHNKDWAFDPEFVKIDDDFKAFLEDLPADMQVSYPSDGSPAWIPSAFVGNLHAYYHLSLILFHRPVLTFLDPTSADGQWKHHMMICYNAARALCRLQEAVVDTYGLTAMQCMQRGFSFTLYAGLSCIVLHLVAIVSPDPDLNSDAREYFERHMRLLEKVMEVWHVNELQVQIDAFREAFSANVRKPFVLKPSFPYGSPLPSDHSGSPRMGSGVRPTIEGSGNLLQGQMRNGRPQPVSFFRRPISPPSSAPPQDKKSDVSSLQSMGMMPVRAPEPGMQQAMSLPDAGTWNPSRIFEQWNTSFGPTAQNQRQSDSESPVSLKMELPPGATTMRPMGNMQSSNAQLTGPPAIQQQQMPQQAFPTTAAAMPQFITPAMWQASVASVYEGGLKRAWDYDDGGSMLKPGYNV